MQQYNFDKEIQIDAEDRPPDCIAAAVSAAAGSGSGISYGTADDRTGSGHDLPSGSALSALPADGGAGSGYCRNEGSAVSGAADASGSSPGSADSSPGDRKEGDRVSGTDSRFREYRRTRDISLRNELVEEHLFMVDILIRKYLDKGIDRDDLYQVGAMALISAVERFDPERGFKFSSFATPTILGEIKKYFRDKGWSVRVPRNLKEISIAMPGAKDELISRYGRVPTVTEIADYMNISEEDALAAMESGLAYDAFSLNTTYDEEDGTGDPRLLEKAASADEEGYERLEDYEIISRVLQSLTSTDKYIFRQRFVEEKSQAEIAAELGVSQMTISRVERKMKEKFARELRR